SLDRPHRLGGSGLLRHVSPLGLTGGVAVVSVLASMSKILPVLTIAILSLGAAGCSDKAPAVARVEVTPTSLRLGYPELQTVHLNWQPVAPLEGVSVQPTVFLHLRDDKNELVR